MSANKTKKVFDLKTSYVGTCQACFNQQVVKATRGRQQHVLVLHGYERPGFGYIKGQCWGVDHPPFELNCELTKRWKAHCEHSLDLQRARHADLEADRVKSFEVRVPDHDAPNPGWGMPQPKKFITLGRGDTYVDVKAWHREYTFEGARKHAIGNCEKYIKELVETIKFLGERIAAWKYAPELLLSHETVKTNEKAAKEQNKLAAGFRRTWKEGWKDIVQAIQTHKDYAQSGYDHAYGRYKGMVAALPKFPTNKERAEARANAKKGA